MKAFINIKLTTVKGFLAKQLNNDYAFRKKKNTN